MLPMNCLQQHLNFVWYPNTTTIAITNPSWICYTSKEAMVGWKMRYGGSISEGRNTLYCMHISPLIEYKAMLIYCLASKNTYKRHVTIVRKVSNIVFYPSYLSDIDLGSCVKILHRHPGTWESKVDLKLFPACRLQTNFQADNNLRPT